MMNDTPLARRLKRLLLPVLQRSLAFVFVFVLAHPAAAQTGNEFDCVDAFDAITLATTFRCALTDSPTAAADAIVAAKTRLVDNGFFRAEELDHIAVSWCPLTNALGYTPNAASILLDSGLRGGSTDLIAEVVAHEMVHVRQFQALGAEGFKCAYVDAFVRCGACQDRANRFEEAAYRLQDEVRERLLEDWLTPGTRAPAVAPASAPGDPH